MEVWRPDTQQETANSYGKNTPAQRECGERTKGRGAPRKGRGEGQLFRVYEALTGMKRGTELWLGLSEAVRSTLYSPWYTVS